MSEQTEPTIFSIMTRNPITVRADMTVYQAAELMISRHYAGVPVVDKEKRLVGIITLKEIINKAAAMHSPLLNQLLKGVGHDRKKIAAIHDELEGLLKIKVEEIMNRSPFTIKSTETVASAISIFSKGHGINPMLVVNTEGRLVGVLSKFDIVKLYAPGTQIPYLIKNPLAKNPSKTDAPKFIRDFEASFTEAQSDRAKALFILALMAALVGIGFIIALVWSLNISISFHL